MKELKFRGLAADADTRTRGSYAANRIMSGQCYEYSSFSDNDLLFTLWPLAPALFPMRPAYQTSKLQDRIAHQPYLVHYNWLIGVDGKRDSMKSDGFWFV